MTASAFVHATVIAANLVLPTLSLCETLVARVPGAMKDNKDDTITTTTMRRTQ